MYDGGGGGGGGGGATGCEFTTGGGGGGGSSPHPLRNAEKANEQPTIAIVAAPRIEDRPSGRRLGCFWLVMGNHLHRAFDTSE